MCCCQNFSPEKNNTITILIKKTLLNFESSLKKAGSCLELFNLKGVLDVRYFQWKIKLPLQLFHFLLGMVVDQMVEIWTMDVQNRCCNFGCTPRRHPTWNEQWHYTVQPPVTGKYSTLFTRHPNPYQQFPSNNSSMHSHGLMMLSFTVKIVADLSLTL